MQRLKKAQNLISGSVGKIETVAVKLQSESLIRKNKFDMHGRHTSNKKAWQSAKSLNTKPFCQQTHSQILT